MSARPVAGAAPAEVALLSPARFAWRRFRHDRVAVTSALVLLAIVVLVFPGAPVAQRLVGHGPNDLYPYSVNTSLRPVGPWTHVPDVTGFADPAAVAKAPTTLLALGADGPLGRDELLRLLYGGRVSLEVALGATLLALFVGVLLGAAAGFFGGLVDAIVSRLTEIVMAFPMLLFVIMVAATVVDHIANVTFGGALNRGVIALVLVIGAFTWFYPARIVRARVLELREREFVEAARMVGAGPFRILRTHVFPHLVPQLAVYAMLLAATNILLEAGLTFLGVGIRLPTASWGSLLAVTFGTVTRPTTYDPNASTPWLVLLPSLAILLTVLSLNLLGEGLRDALDPQGAPR